MQVLLEKRAHHLLPKTKRWKQKFMIKEIYLEWVEYNEQVLYGNVISIIQSIE